MKFVQTCLLALFAATSGVVHAAKTIYVDSNAADDNGDGLSLETAKKTIQAAIDVAAKNDTILIAKGRYLISSSLKIAHSEEEGIHSIELRGATGDPEEVVVDAQGLCPCLVASGWNQIIVNSIAFENGCSTNDPNVAGGITATDKSMITNCIVRSCYHGMSGQNVYGGGINLTTQRADPNVVATHWPDAQRYLPQVVNTLVENCAAYILMEQLKVLTFEEAVCIWLNTTLLASRLKIAPLRISHMKMRWTLRRAAAHILTVPDMKTIDLSIIPL